MSGGSSGVARNPNSITSLTLILIGLPVVLGIC